MNKLDRLEMLAQQLIEGTFNRLFQPKPPDVTPADKQRTTTKEIRVAQQPNSAGQWALQLGERRIQLGEPVVSIGRALDNDIVLNDPAVSRYHAQLRWRNKRYYLCHPSVSKNGQAAANRRIWLNRQPVTQAPLSPGDEILLGNTGLHVLVTASNR